METTNYTNIPSSPIERQPAFAPWGFLLVTFGFSWIIWIIPILMHFGIIFIADQALLRGITMSFVILGAFGPVTGAIVMSRHESGKGAIRKHLIRIFKINNSWKWYFIPFILLGIIQFTVWGGSLFWGESPLKSFLPTPWIIPIYMILMMFLGGGQEEIGWRGFALDRLLSRHNDFMASLILGSIWGLWHLPLWFMTGSGQVYIPFPAFLLWTISMSVIMTWIYIGSKRSLFISMWTHGLSNSLTAIFPVLILMIPANQFRYWIYSCTIAITSLIITFIRGFNRRSGSI